MKSTFILIIAALLVLTESSAQVMTMNTPRLDALQGTTSTQLPNNSIAHIVAQGTTVYAGTSKGLTRTPDGGATWESFRSVPQFANDGIYALAVRGNRIWAATGFNEPSPSDPSTTVQTGSGFAYSQDNGVTWTHLPQPLDPSADSIVSYGSNRLNFLPIIVPEQNVTFDAALTDNAIWIASWSSGLRRSTNNGLSWIRTPLPNDTLNSIKPSDPLGTYSIDPRINYNFLAFSVYVQDDTTIWCGTAGGINKTTDGGISWAKFSAQNQLSPILGDWVIAIDGQPIGANKRIWCTSWKANGATEQYGVNYTDDGGRIWKNFLPGIKSYAFAFKDLIAYVATDNGIFRTDDNGVSWTQSGTIIDKSTGARITTSRFYTVGVVGDTVFCGSDDGLVKTVDNAAHPFGETWQVFRAYKPVGNTSNVYAYPNPFAPRQEVARVHYSTSGRDASVTVEVFDFGMNRVRTIVKDAPRSGSIEHDEIWDGMDDSRRTVANGVYFYRVTIDGGSTSWGKVMVLQ